ncbi:amphi-Trp domain-containing protein [Haloarchaeobius sp. DFWS5]|uniref:amphi-Trp domain-containing protein n=1 Tax=Haloarchaeobius sp. DFWS5 TaxID=3446114 RepID=UPI003EC056A2
MVEIETEEQKSRAEIAACLRVLADQFERDGEVRLVLGGETVTFDPTETLTVRLETESDWSPRSARVYRRVGFDLEWIQDTAHDNRVNVVPTSELPNSEHNVR